MLINITRPFLKKLRQEPLFLNYFRNKKGAMSVEFAFTVPLFIAALFGTLELANFIMVDRRADFAVDYNAEIMSRITNSSVLSRDVFQGETVFAMVNPTSSPRYNLNPAFWARRSHEMAIASVDMVRTNPVCEGEDCEFQPVILWKYDRAYYLGGQLRPFGCNVDVVAGKPHPEADSIPEAFVGRSPLVMTRIAYEYHPLILKNLIPTQFHKKSAIRHIRSNKAIRHYSRGLYCPGQF